MALRIDSRGITGECTARGLVGHGRALVQCADLWDVVLCTLLSSALALWDNGRGRAAGLRKAANFDGGFGRAVRSIWRGV